MGDHTVKSGAISQPMTVNFEQTPVKMRADIIPCSEDQKQRSDDDLMIPHEGQQREMFQEGNIVSSDGETVMPVSLQFIRTRNKNGGVDVKCIVPALPAVANNYLEQQME